jgi:hypothetical protein
MKKTLVLGLLGVALSVSSACAQGFIALDNYNSAAHPLVTFGAGAGGAIGTGLGAGWTAGLYFASGTVTLSSGNDVIGGPFVLGTGLGSTASFATSAFGELGQFAASDAFQASAVAGSTVSIVVVAYQGASYDNAAVRGHSAAFTMTANAGTSFPLNAGDFMSAFSVTPVPEPSTFALAGLGSAAMLIFRRRK